MGFILWVMFAGPLLIIAWSIVVLRRWTGRWRFALLAPIAVLGAGLTEVALEMRHDPMGHGGWPLWWVGSVIAAALTCFGLDQAHRYHQAARSTSIPDEHAV